MKRKYKLDEYLNIPWWQRELDEEGEPKYESQEDYEEANVAKVDAWLIESRRYHRAVKKQWARAVSRFERSLDKLSDMSGASDEPAYSDLPFLYKAILELVAMLFDSLPRPQYLPRQATEDEFVGALNYWGAWELDANDFDITMFDIGLDINLFNLGILKQTVDPEGTGPFDQDGRIVFRKTEPRYFWPDPYAGTLKWGDAKYWIFAEPYDLGDIRKTYPTTGFRVEPESRYSTMRGDKDSGEEGGDDDTGTIMQSPANAIGLTGPVGERWRAVVKECWLLDYSLEFVAEEEFVPTKDADGNPKMDDNGKPVGETKIKLDEKGDVIGYHRRRFPNGRLLVTANKVLLYDEPIDKIYRHKQPPYTFFRGRPTKKLLSPGDATFLLIVERKLNEIYGRVMRNAMCNIATPLIVDAGAFDAPKKYRNLTDDPDIVIELRPNARLDHLKAGEIPQFVIPFAAFLKGFFDDLMGINDVQRGQLTEGAQLSSEALGALQDQASSRIRMKSRLIENALKQMGYQLMWNIRATYPSDKVITIMDPSSGEPHEVTWNDDEAQDDYAVVIQAGSSLPGAKMGAYKQALELYREGIADDEFVLDAAQVPGKQRIMQRTQEKRDKRLTVAIEAKEMGVAAKERQNYSGQPGRRVKE